MAKDFHFFVSSVDVEPNDIAEMQELAEKVSLRTIRDNCVTAQVEQHLGYSREFPIDNDPEVEFFKSKFMGMPCYFILHSGVEYVFVRY